MPTLLKRTPLALAVAALALPALAQQQIVIEEIVVTAQKRQESIQDTPISLAAFSNSDIENLGISDLTDLQGTTPNLQLAPFPTSPTTTTVFIRGVGNADTQITKDPAVGIYLDGVYLGRSAGLAADIADIERIEVLRGPQGTLYGRNTTGGAINFVTKKPTGEFGFKQQLSVGNRDFWRSQTMVEFPMGERFAAKLGYSRSAKSGWVKNENGANWGENDGKEAGSLALRWFASDRLTVDYAYDFSDTEVANFYAQPGQSLVHTNVSRHRLGHADYGRPGDGTFISGLITAGIQAGVLDDSAVLNSYRPNSLEIEGHAVTVAWEGDGITLKSITSYRELDDKTYMNLGNLVYSNVDRSQEQWSQEFQVIGDALDERLEYTAGLYYFHEEGEEHQLVNNYLLASIDPLLVKDDGVVEAENDAYAVYGQASYLPPILDDRLKVTVGLRYSVDQREAKKTNNQFFAGNGGTIDGDDDWNQLNPSLIVSYDMLDNLNVYAKWVTGYRTGGFNARGSETYFGTPFDEETLTSYEIGAKSDWFDNRLRVNLAVFSTDYEDLQVDQSDPVNIALTRVVNAGTAKMNGAELDITAVPMAGLELKLSYAYMDAEYEEFLTTDDDDIDSDGNTSELLDYSHLKDMAYAPRHTVDLGVEYAFEPFAFGQLIANVNYHWQDEQFSSSNQTAWIDDYGLLNARLSLVDIPVGEGSARVALWGRNLDNQEYLLLAASVGAFVGQVYGEPRSYGVDFVYEY